MVEKRQSEKKLLFGTTLKHLGNLDIFLAKLSIIAFALFLVRVWPLFGNWVNGTPWTWFFIAWIVLMILPITKIWK